LSLALWLLVVGVNEAKWRAQADQAKLSDINQSMKPT